MQLASKKIIVLNLGDFDAKEIIILSVDCVNYPTTEFRLVLEQSGTTIKVMVPD